MATSGVAVVMVCLALFYAEFTDPAVAASLEVIDYDEDSGTASPFKVQVKDGVWSIPSHFPSTPAAWTRNTQQ